MRVTLSSNRDISELGLRLEASYYLSDGVQSLTVLKKFKRTQKLSEVTRGRVFISGRSRRVYVEDPAHGVPFLSSSDMSLAVFDTVKYVSKKHTTALQSLLLEHGWTLISRSGTIGNAAYARPDMTGMAASEHIMRVVPDIDKIKPGYLYAFLSSILGKAILVQGTFGSVIPTIEPDYVLSIPIPRLGDRIEGRIHDMNERASQLRIESEAIRKSAINRMNETILGLPKNFTWQHVSEHSRAIEAVKFPKGRHRLDAFHYVGYVAEGAKFIGKTARLGDIAKPYQPPVFKRPYTNAEHGIPFLSGIDLYDVTPKPHMWISRRMKDLGKYIVKSDTLLVQNVGQRYGLFGRPTILPEHLDGSAVTQHLMRVYPLDPNDRGFLYTYLLCEVGRRELLKHSFGTSMGVLFQDSFARTEIPDCSATVRHSFETEISRMLSLRNEAYRLETNAQQILVSELGL